MSALPNPHQEQIMLAFKFIKEVTSLYKILWTDSVSAHSKLELLSSFEYFLTSLDSKADQDFISGALEIFFSTENKLSLLKMKLDPAQLKILDRTVHSRSTEMPALLSAMAEGLSFVLQTKPFEEKTLLEYVSQKAFPEGKPEITARTYATGHTKPSTKIQDGLVYDVSRVVERASKMFAVEEGTPAFSPLNNQTEIAALKDQSALFYRGRTFLTHPHKPREIEAGMQYSLVTLAKYAISQEAIKNRQDFNYFFNAYLHPFFLEICRETHYQGCLNAAKDLLRQHIFENIHAHLPHREAPLTTLDATPGVDSAICRFLANIPAPAPAAEAPGSMASVMMLGAGGPGPGVAVTASAAEAAEAAEHAPETAPE